jgi:molecular chaperone DnaK (HSP70)
MSTLQIDFGDSKTHIVGIDLGTTNSLVSIMDLTGPRILSGIVPSVVSVLPSGEVIAGVDARERLVTDPASTVYSAKRRRPGRTQALPFPHRPRQ